MSATKPEDLSTSNWAGDTEKTEITNDLATEPGFPAELEDGSTVLIVRKDVEGQGETVMVDDAGNKYRANQGGKLVELDEVDTTSEERLPETSSISAEDLHEREAELERKIASGEISAEDAAAERARIDEGVTGKAEETETEQRTQAFGGIEGGRKEEQR